MPLGEFRLTCGRTWAWASVYKDLRPGDFTRRDWMRRATDLLKKGTAGEEKASCQDQMQRTNQCRIIGREKLQVSQKKWCSTEESKTAGDHEGCVPASFAYLKSEV